MVRLLCMEISNGATICGSTVIWSVWIKHLLFSQSLPLLQTSLADKLLWTPHSDLPPVTRHQTLQTHKLNKPSADSQEVIHTQVKEKVVRCSPSSLRVSSEILYILLLIPPVWLTRVRPVDVLGELALIPVCVSFSCEKNKKRNGHLKDLILSINDGSSVKWSLRAGNMQSTIIKYTLFRIDSTDYSFKSCKILQRQMSF